jgi:hypothetical protein
MEPLQREPLGAQEVQAACESVTADGINALSNFVDSRVQWVMPDKWIWIPGVYEFESTQVPKKNTTVVCKYTMILFDDKSVKYTWYNTESSKKTIEHMLTIEGNWLGCHGRPKLTRARAGTWDPPAAKVNEEGEHIDTMLIHPVRASFTRIITGSTNKVDAQHCFCHIALLTVALFCSASRSRPRRIAGSSISGRTKPRN